MIRSTFFMGRRAEERLSVYMEAKPSAAMVLFRHLCGSCARQEWPDGINMPWPAVRRRLHDRPRLGCSVMIAESEYLHVVSIDRVSYTAIGSIFRQSIGLSAAFLDTHREVGSWLIDKRDR